MKKSLTNYLYNLGINAGKKREEKLISLIEENKNVNFLDCGCSEGDLTIRIANKIGTRKIFGVEIDAESISKARKKKIKVLKADLNNKLPFDNETFDVVTAIEVVEHLHETDTFLKELYRICKKNGYVIIGTENLASWHNVFALFLGLQPSTGPHISENFSIGFHPLSNEHKKNPDKWKNAGKHINVLTRDTLKKISLSHRFIIENERTSGFYPFPGLLSDVLSKIDKRHALTILLKLRKK